MKGCLIQMANHCSSINKLLIEKKNLYIYNLRLEKNLIGIRNNKKLRLNLNFLF